MLTFCEPLFVQGHGHGQVNDSIQYRYKCFYPHRWQNSIQLLFATCLISISSLVFAANETSSTTAWPSTNMGATSNAGMQGAGVQGPNSVQDVLQKNMQDAVNGGTYEVVRRAVPAPLSSPPFPSSEYAFGGSQMIGAASPSEPFPLTKALWNTSAGAWLKEKQIQVYGWIDTGVTFGTSSISNLPMGYAQSSNSLQLDQAVIRFEKVPDEIQIDHFDWGFRADALYGIDYRFTNAYGIWGSQYSRDNLRNGFDTVMLYGDLYFPHWGEGTNVRIGRYISVPDIEAQLAPDNYFYTHSLLYGYDPYTNWGVLATTRINKNFFVQYGLNLGNDVAPWKSDLRVPGLTVCARLQSDSGGDAFYPCLNSINDGKARYSNQAYINGYGSAYAQGAQALANYVSNTANPEVNSYHNNVQQAVFTYAHKFNETWHNQFEYWTMWQREVPTYFINPLGNATNGSMQCANNAATCRAAEYAFVDYLEYLMPNQKDNIGLRFGFFNDKNGERTGFRTRYQEIAVNYVYFFNKLIYVRPELSYQRSLDMAAFNVNPYAPDGSTAKNHQLTLSMDLIVRY